MQRAIVMLLNGDISPETRQVLARQLNDGVPVKGELGEAPRIPSAAGDELMAENSMEGLPPGDGGKGQKGTGNPERLERRFGLGENIPMSTANLMGGLVALKDGQMVSLRVPYPLGWYAKGFDGRIDDPNGGWKGRGLWSASGDRTPWLREGGKGSKPLAVHFQIRPDPLAR